MKVLAIYDGSGPKYHRILLPVSLMDGIELTVSHTITDENADCDILFFNRGVSRVSLYQVLEYKKQYGFKMICDLDDHWRLNKDHILFNHYENSNLSEIIEAYIKESDLITVTHERLLTEVWPLNKNVHILPNAIPYFGQFTYPKTESELIRLFWAGSVTHVKDIELLRNPVKRFNFPVKMVLGGYADNKEYIRMASAYTNSSKLNNLLLKALPVEQYYAMYSECDISLIPLMDNTFNRHKSNLKILESANIKSPVIVSNVHPYKDMPVNYVNRQSDWYTHVKRLVSNPNEIKDQGEALHQYCNIHFNFDKINSERKQIFDVATKQREIREASAFV